MMFRPRVQPGVPAGGQFASKAQSESPVTLADRRRHENVLFQNLAGGKMDPGNRRRLARSAALQALSDGTAARMLGSSGINDLGLIESAARQDTKLDRALAEVVKLEQVSPGRVPSNALGYHLCKQLLLAERSPQRMAS